MASLHHRNYRLLWSTTFFSGGGLWLQQIVIGWLTYNETRSAFLTSLALGLDALPILLIGPLVGVIVDKWDRRKLLVFMFVYQALVTLGFSAIVIMDRTATWHIFAFVFLMGMSWVVADPTRMSLIPTIVPKENLINAFALNGMAFSAMRLAAPAIGGLLLALIGAGRTLLLGAVMPLAALEMALRLRVGSSSRPLLRINLVWPEILEGARYVTKEPVILRLFFLSMLTSVLVMPFVHSLMPVYAAEVFGVGPTGLGLLMAALGAGATLSTFILASLGNVRRKGLLIIVSMVTMGLAMVALSLNPFYGLAFPTLMVFSGGTMIFLTTSNAIIQTIVRSDLRGRVTALQMTIWGLFPAGSLLAGALADQFSAPRATLIAAGLLAAGLAVLAPQLRSLWRFQ